MNLVQPMIWLLLFGQLFKSVVDIPGFAAGQTYLEFLTPGIVMMMALFGSAWAGTTYIQDMDRGVMDRLLTSPTSRGALMVSTLVYQAVLTVGQTLIVLGVASLFGARFGGDTDLGHSGTPCCDIWGLRKWQSYAHCRRSDNPSTVPLIRLGSQFRA